MARTLAQLRTDTRRLIDETDSSNSSYEDSELNDYLNQAARKIAGLLEWTIATYTATSVESQAQYTLPSGMLYICEVHFDGKPISIVDRSDLSGLYGEWMNADDGEPVVAYRADNNVLGFYQAPSVDFAGKTITIQTIKLPTDLTADGDVVDLHELLQDAMPLRAAMFAQVRAGNFKAAQFLEALFDKEILGVKSKINKFAEDLASFRWS